MQALKSQVVPAPAPVKRKYFDHKDTQTDPVEVCTDFRVGTRMLTLVWSALTRLSLLPFSAVIHGVSSSI